MPTKQEFLQKVRTKYPAYNAVEDNVLYEKITTKHPEYKAQITDDVQVDTPKPQVWDNYMSQSNKEPLQSSNLPTQDNVITNNLVDKWQLPEVQRENIPQDNWIKPSTLSLPSNLALKAPVKEEYQKKLFSDEKQIVDQMKQDWYDETIARETIENRRKAILSKTKINKEETLMLGKMADAWIDTQTAVQWLKEFRSDKRKAEYEALPALKKAWKSFMDFTVSTLAWWVWEVWWIAEFVTWWRVWEWAMKWREYQREIMEWSKAAAAWDVLGKWIIDYYAWKVTWKAPIWKWRTIWKAVWGLWSVKQWIIWWAWFGAATTVWEKWKETTAWDIWQAALIWWALWGTIVAAAPAVIWWAKWVISKVWKYWKAWQKWWPVWLWKSVIRDVKKPFVKIKTEWIAPKASASMSTRANRFTKWKEKDFIKMTWESTWEFATKRGMTKTWDRAVEEASELFTKSIKEADDALNLIDWNYKITKGTDYMKEMLWDLSKRLGNVLSKDSKRVNMLLKKYNSKWLTMTESNLAKRIYAKNHKYSFVDAWWEAALKSKNLQDWVRSWQFKTAKEQWFKNLGEINKTTQAWKFYADNLADNIWGKWPNNAISLTDWVALSWWEPTNVALFLGKKVWEIPWIKEWLIKSLGKKTKPSIIKANKMSIFKSNLKKENVNVRNILRDRTTGSSTSLLKKPKPLRLKAWTKEPIITPQTQEKAIIQQSKIELKPWVIKKVGKKVDLKGEKWYNDSTLITKPKKMTTTPQKRVWISDKAEKEILDYWRFKEKQFRSSQDELDYLIQNKFKFDKNWAIHKEVSNRIKDLEKVVKKYKTPIKKPTKIKRKQVLDKVDEFKKFEKKNNPVWIEFETQWSEKVAVIDLFPNKLVKGKGITKSRTLISLQDSYNKWHKIIEPSNWLWTEEWKWFFENIKKMWVVEKISNRWGIERYRITSKIKDLKIEDKLLSLFNKN